MGAMSRRAFRLRSRDSGSWSGSGQSSSSSHPMRPTIAVGDPQDIEGIARCTACVDDEYMNISSVGPNDAQMVAAAKSVQAAREQSAAPTAPENVAKQVAATQTNVAVATQAAGLVNTYA